MFHTKVPGKSFMNREEYRDKVLGCWTGKNIGGTLGAPMEGKRDIFDVTFYTQDLKGHPAPNDDLDLQLVWLRAIEDNGLFSRRSRGSATTASGRTATARGSAPKSGRACSRANRMRSRRSPGATPASITPATASTPKSSPQRSKRPHSSKATSAN